MLQVPLTRLALPVQPSQAKPRPFKCVVPGCGKSYVMQQGLRDHEKKKHGRQPKFTRFRGFATQNLTMGEGSDAPYSEGEESQEMARFSSDDQQEYFQGENHSDTGEGEGTAASVFMEEAQVKSEQDPVEVKIEQDPVDDQFEQDPVEVKTEQDPGL